MNNFISFDVKKPIKKIKLTLFEISVSSGKTAAVAKQITKMAENTDNKRPFILIQLITKCLLFDFLAEKIK